MTGQPMELSRMLPFFVLCVLTSLTAQAFGFFIGATLPVTVSISISAAKKLHLGVDARTRQRKTLGWLEIAEEKGRAGLFLDSRRDRMFAPVSR
jgi:hypothetical protein